MTTYGDVTVTGPTAEESRILALFDIFGQKNLDSLMFLAKEQTQTAFAKMNATINSLEGQSLNVSTSPTPAAIPIREALEVKRAEREATGLISAFTSAAEVVFEVWRKHPKYGFETAIPHGTTEERWETCEKLLPYAEGLRNYILNASEYDKVNCGTYTLASLWSEVAWFYHEMSKYTEAGAFGTLGLSICDRTLATTFACLLTYEQRVKFFQLRAELEGTRAIIACDIGDKRTALFYGQKQFFPFNVHSGQGQEDKAQKLAHAFYIIGKVSMLTGTGELLYALGNAAAMQERWDPSAEYYARAATTFHKTVGMEHASAAKTAFKLACYYLRVQSHYTASAKLHQSLKVYESAPLFEAQRARCHFKTYEILVIKGTMLGHLGVLQLACDLRNGLVRPEEVKQPWDLVGQDFDDLVVVWDR